MWWSLLSNVEKLTFWCLVRTDPVKFREKSFVWYVPSSRTPINPMDFNLNTSFFQIDTVAAVFHFLHHRGLVNGYRGLETWTLLVFREVCTEAPRKLPWKPPQKPPLKWTPWHWSRGRKEEEKNTLIRFVTKWHHMEVERILTRPILMIVLRASLTVHVCLPILYFVWRGVGWGTHVTLT